jgi:glycosyltransferase involved in cell wall biosynthesis
MLVDNGQVIETPVGFNYIADHMLHEDVLIGGEESGGISFKGHIPEDRFQWSKGVEFDRYPSTLAFMHFDIGLAPVTSARFNQAKSNLKWLEYSSIGVPTVASKVYPYEKSIEHGVTGYVCETEADWYQALTTLVNDAALRQRIGAQAKAHVWAHWGTSRAHSWATLFTKLLRERHGEQLSPQLGRSPGVGVLVAPPA